MTSKPATSAAPLRSLSSSRVLCRGCVLILLFRQLYRIYMISTGRQGQKQKQKQKKKRNERWTTRSVGWITSMGNKVVVRISLFVAVLAVDPWFDSFSRFTDSITRKLFLLPFVSISESRVRLLIPFSIDRQCLLPKIIVSIMNKVG